MKLKTLIDNIGGRYNVQVTPFEFTAAEQAKIEDYGQPLVEIGGAFAGSAYRIGGAATTVAITGDGAAATATPVVLSGQVVDVTITDPGTGYTAATVAIAGDGANAAGLAHFKVVQVDITTPGTEYEAGDTISFPGLNGGDVTVILSVTGVDGDGGVTEVEIVNAGNLLEVPDSPTLITSGTGIDFAATLTWGIGSIVLSSFGSGYSVVPVTVTFELPTATRRLMTDGPFKQIFDLADDSDSDVKAKVWADTVVARCVTAKNFLMAQNRSFEGESVITV